MNRKRTGESVEIRKPRDEAEARTFAEVVSRALFFHGFDHSAFVRREGLDNIRVACKSGAIVGGLAIQRMGQWFGGKSVPMGAVRTVGTAAEHRASGVGSALMRACVEELHADGVPISVLYPATQPLYRRVGFEKAGVRRRYRMPADAIDLRERALDVRPVGKGDTAVVRKLYAERARSTAGNLDRSNWVWDRILDPPPWAPPSFGYLVHRGRRPEGYVCIAPRPGEAVHRNVLDVIDLVVITPDAARRIWTLLADHRSMAGTITWCGAPADPTLYLLAEQRFELIEPLDWMIRIVDVRGALTARGYPTGLSTELHLDVRDDLLPRNHGRFVLRVEDGRAEVSEGGRGDLVIDIRGLAPLYTGHLSPFDLMTTGYLDATGKGAERAFASAGAIFAGPAPWMPDIF